MIEAFSGLFDRRALVRAVAASALAAGAALPSAALAQGKWPEKPVRVVVPFGAGGVADVTSRIVGEKLGAKLGQRFIIENVPAAGGIQAAQNVLRDPADGYTVALFSNGTAVSVGLFKKLAFDPVKQFAPVSSMGYFDFVFASSSSKPFKTMGELLKYAKANPGKLNVGTVVVGSTQNLTAQLFKSEAGLDVAIVPFKTTPDLMLATMNGDIDVMIDSFASLKTNIAEGKLRALGSSGAKRSEAHPDIPTVAEGGVPGFDVVSWNAFFVRAETPKEIIATLNAAMREVLADPDTRKRALELGIETRGSTPEEIRKRLTDDIARWSSVIEKAGIEKR
jgi:tripartite-type tricarboxylate transporter receptor subunit TctC